MLVEGVGRFSVGNGVSLRGSAGGATFMEVVTSFLAGVKSWESSSSGLKFDMNK